MLKFRDKIIKSAIYSLENKRYQSSVELYQGSYFIAITEKFSDQKSRSNSFEISMFGLPDVSKWDEDYRNISDPIFEIKKSRIDGATGEEK